MTRVTIRPDGSRREMNRILVRRAVEEGRPNYAIENLISSVSGTLEEKAELREYLGLVRTERGEELGILTGESMLSDFFRSDVAPVPQPAKPRQADIRSNPAWLEIVAAYRRCGRRPKQFAVAEKMGFTNEQPLRNRLRDLGIADWRQVHALVAAE